MNAFPKRYYLQLAVVAMAEHGTRNTEQHPHTPATGLLFGTAEGIIDAVDVPESAFDTVVALQMAVYPHQHVVGWYRVGTVNTTSMISPSDLKMSRNVKHRFPEARYLLTLDGTSDVAIFALEDDNANEPILINIEFRLETATAERIAVERLLREDKGAAKMIQMNNSVETLADRMDTLLKYLETADNCDPSNLRRIQSVICNVRFLHHTSNDPTADIEGLVSLADVVALSRAYTETSKLKHKSTGTFSAFS